MAFNNRKKDFNNQNYYNGQQNYNNGQYRDPNGFRGFDPNGFFGRLAARMSAFMVGRYGYDSMSGGLTVAAFVLMLLSSFRVLRILNFVALVLFGWSVFRIYSRNIYKRQQENAKYLQLKARLLNRNRSGYSGASHSTRKENMDYYNRRENQQTFKDKMRIRKARKADTEHTYLKCEGCGMDLRVPRGVGTIDVTCPRCRMKTRIRA